jgi:hypothetical protein
VKIIDLGFVIHGFILLDVAFYFMLIFSAMVLKSLT